MKISDRYILLFSTMPTVDHQPDDDIILRNFVLLAAFMTDPADFQSVQRQSLLLQVLLW